MDMLSEVVSGLLMLVVYICRSWAGSWTVWKASRRRLATMKSLARLVVATMPEICRLCMLFIHACWQRHLLPCSEHHHLAAEARPAGRVLCWRGHLPQDVRGQRALGGRHEGAQFYHGAPHQTTIGLSEAGSLKHTDLCGMQQIFKADTLLVSLCGVELWWSVMCSNQITFHTSLSFVHCCTVKLPAG
jgi:hypothetical protein